MSRVKKLTVSKLKRMISEEKKKLKDAGKIDVETVDDAWAGGDNLVHHIDFVKKLGIKESNLRKKADSLARARAAIKKKIVRDL
tara:strand:+ start:119 stop:370 length:252 start_codon:yes stop_codon:yes gene_type:complete